MIYDESTFNPFVNWKLDLIKQMIKDTPGYEDIEIVFEYYTDYYSYKNPMMVITGGIKQWDGWLFKLNYLIDELEDSNKKMDAWVEFQEKLIKSVWITAIKSFKTDLKKLNSYE